MADPIHTVAALGRVLAMAVVVLLPACGRAGDEQLVRDGTMIGYTQTTIGKAFAGSFDNAAWSSFVTAKGIRIVEFRGTINPTLHRSAVNRIKVEVDQARAREGTAFWRLVRYFQPAYEVLKIQPDGLNRLLAKHGCTGVSRTSMPAAPAISPNVGTTGSPSWRKPSRPGRTSTSGRPARPCASSGRSAKTGRASGSPASRAPSGRTCPPRPCSTSPTTRRGKPRYSPGRWWEPDPRVLSTDGAQPMTDPTPTDPTLRPLEDVIDNLPNVAVSGTYREPHPDSKWAVIFGPRREPDLPFFVSLELLASLKREAYAAGLDVALTVNAAPPHLNGVGKSMYFVLEGTRGEPDRYVELVRRIVDLTNSVFSSRQFGMLPISA